MHATTQRRAELARLRDALSALDQQRQRLEEVTDGPFALFLTERMLKDLDQARKLCRQLQQQATWPSLN